MCKKKPTTIKLRLYKTEHHDHDNGAYRDVQVISAYYDQSGSLVMGPRTGTPMRLVSPAPPVLVPPGAAGPRAPQAPPIYPPQPQTAQQNVYSAQNGSNVGGMYIAEDISLRMYYVLFLLLLICVN
uniref:Uncharacterized protein n=1 Tax=Anopheles culicifacies TaxID=139723 RepID=A0A182LRZ8_9DIPT